MSSHAASVSLGRTASADGHVKVVDVVGHLYIGGTGAWHFRNLSNDEADRRVTLRSAGPAALWQEVAAAFAVLQHHQAGLDDVADGVRAMGVGSKAQQIEGDQVAGLAGLVADVPVAAALAFFSGQVPQEVFDLERLPGWSVHVAGPAFERSHSRWGTTDTRPQDDS